MMLSKEYDYNGAGRRVDTVKIITTPRKCPRCKAFISPDYISTTIVSDSKITVQYWCRSCNQTFNTDYSGYIGSNYSKYNFVANEIVESYPNTFKVRVFDDLINDLSPDFVNIYNQALQAETLNIIDICGMAYRKSLEFLIKDYAIHKNPDKKDKISNPKYSLSSCINDFVTATNLQNTSKVTAWLGNDETHYTRIHNDKDLNDLKKYLDSAIYFIMYDLVAEDADDLINPQD